MPSDAWEILAFCETFLRDAHRKERERERLKSIVHADTNAAGIYREVGSRGRVVAQSAARLLRLSEIIER